MLVSLAYGEGRLEIDLPDDRTTVIEPEHMAGLPDERAAVEAALRDPIGAAPLRDWILPGASVVVLFTDITRATPNERILPWLLNHLTRAGVDRRQITLVNQVGTHRPNTRDELVAMLGPEVVANYTIVNPDPYRREEYVPLGVTRTGAPALIHRTVVEAGVRILTGYIEPHFFAGFSGGPKAVMPGVAHVDTVLSNHSAGNLAHPMATFGVCEGNPVWEEMLEIARRVGPSFLLNVALNARREITGVFAGDLLEAHRAGREFVKAAAMRLLPEPFDVVVTTNSGYPLDQNLYQGVKGLSAAARILKDQGAIILAAECREGTPSGSPYDQILREGRNPEEILARLAQAPQPRAEQWQAQIQALIQRRAAVFLHSRMPAAAVAAAHLTPCPDIAATVAAELSRRGDRSTVAVLPQGPLTIPFLN